jgi:hypothetical protein
LSAPFILFYIFIFGPSSAHFEVGLLSILACCQPFLKFGSLLALTRCWPLLEFGLFVGPFESAFTNSHMPLSLVAR